MIPVQEVKTRETDKLAAQKQTNTYFMCACMHTHVQVCTYMYTPCVFVYVCAVCVHVCAYVCMLYVHACVFIYCSVCTRMWMFVFFALYVYVYMCARFKVMVQIISKCSL